MRAATILKSGLDMSFSNVGIPNSDVPAKMILDFSLCSDNLKPSNKIKRLAKSLFQFFSLIDFVLAKTSNLQKAFHPNGLFHVECTPKAIP